MNLIRHFETEQIKNIERPKLRPGDVVRVETKIIDDEKTRLQKFEGTILGIRGSGPSATMMVRRETGNFGVERIFPIYSPLITNIGIVKRQKVRRAKLYYLRQAGRRRFKEDVEAMQAHVKAEGDKKRLALIAREKKEKLALEKERKEKKEAEKSKETEEVSERAEQEITNQSDKEVKG